LYLYGGKINFYDKAAQQWFDDYLMNVDKPQINSSFRMIEQEQTVVLKLSEFEQTAKWLTPENKTHYLLSIGNFDVNARFEQYKQLFKLTKAEAELAAYLSMGKTINQLASKKPLSKQTLRTQLKRVFIKTETHSQNELIVLLKNVV
jgi:DNA-binding CsgD family transcriptional regulator